MVWRGRGVEGDRAGGSKGWRELREREVRRS